MRGRERDDLVRGLVVVEIVVIVLDEEYRRRAESRAVDGGDLRAARALEHTLVVAAEHDPGAVEPAGDLFGFRRGAVALRGQRRKQIPIDMIAVGDRGLRLEAQRAPEQPVAYG